ncbi:binding-protein-dependent transport systems inner membrane component [Paenibacillus curdlanolyticus YK9]|uniref:Binding-protein-dependent transport systems inner membrane component n=1 Tax=Paenibacillus curdlanolyticus YK9 TaxID=717606 RepID=E0IFF3_9BACL|nr:ABC transporter permease subunit [Paenibacillus curdlanolyticus]EFM08929.1 binding-protein-dependent transport systems inner membrane component [Paenibacillus curdlanolyticus YK9]
MAAVDLAVGKNAQTHTRRKSVLKKVWHYRALIILALPGIIMLFINNYLPMFGIFLAFKDLNYTEGIWGSKWVGFKNFEFLFASNDAWKIIKHTLLYNVAFLVINTVLAVLLAILLNEVKNRVLSKVFQSTAILPNFVSMVIVGYLVFGFLNPELGFVNKSILEPMGKETVAWYASPEYWPYILTIVNTWKSVGYAAIVYLAAIIGIDQEYYEAAKIDGAGKWRQMTAITIPLITPVIIILTLLAIGRIFSADFGLFYQATMASSMLKETTEVIDTYVYNALLVTGDTGLASSAGLLQSVVGFVLVISVNFIVRKFSKENALF